MRADKSIPMVFTKTGPLKLGKCGDVRLWVKMTGTIRSRWARDGLVA